MIKTNQKNKKKKGFTLMELIIVLAVMAIIALIAVPSFSAIRENAKKKADDQTCRTIERVIATYVADETILAKNQKVEITVNTDDKNKITISEVTGTNIFGKESSVQANNKKIVEDALKGVKSPQEKNTQDKYFVTIEDEIVEVKTQAIPTATPTAP